MSTDPKHLEKYMNDKVANNESKTETLVFCRVTNKLLVKKEGDVRGDDKKVYAKMDKWFNVVVHEVVQAREGY